MFAHQRKKIQLLFAIADVLLTIAAFELAYAVRSELQSGMGTVSSSCGLTFTLAAA